MQVFHTCGVPPSLGKIILPIIGWTKNSINALMNSVIAKTMRAKDHLQKPLWPRRCSRDLHEKTSFYKSNPIRSESHTGKTARILRLAHVPADAQSRNQK